LFALRAMGAGDVKLMAAAGAVAGPGNWLVIFLVTALLGGLAALVLVAVRGRVGRTARNIFIVFRELLHLRTPHQSRPELGVGGAGAVSLPHGAVIAAAGLLLLALRCI
jgi:prepilin peptidase CpaA